MEVRIALCAAILALGCAEPRPPVKASPPEQPGPSLSPDTPEAPAAISGPEPPVAPAEPKLPPAVGVIRTDGRTRVALTRPLEELLAIPGGVAWTQSGGVWVLLDDADTPTQVAELTDPHGLTTDGQTLYWVGDTENGQWDLASRELTSWPVFAGPSAQAGLAFGDALYAQDRMGVWRYQGPAARRLPFRIDANWRVLGFRAGADHVFFGVAAMDPQAGGGFQVHKQYVRVRKSGKKTVIPTGLKPFRHRWAVSPEGDLAFIRDSTGAIARLKPNRKTAKVLFEEPGVTTLCFCGPYLCTVAGGTLRRHADGSVETLAEPGDVTALSCTADRVAWSGSVDEQAQLTVLHVAPAASPWPNGGARPHQGK